MIRRTALFATALVLVGCQSHPAPEVATPTVKAPTTIDKPAPDIKGLRLLEHQADVVAKFPDSKCVQEKAGFSCQIMHVGYGGSTSPVITVGFKNDRAVMIQAALLDDDKFDYMISGLTSKLGAPDDLAHRSPLVSPSTITWSGKGWLFAAERHPTGYHYPQVTLFDTTWAMQQIKSQSDEAAKSL